MLGGSVICWDREVEGGHTGASPHSFMQLGRPADICAAVIHAPATYSSQALLAPSSDDLDADSVYSIDESFAGAERLGSGGVDVELAVPLWQWRARIVFLYFCIIFGGFIMIVGTTSSIIALAE